MPSLNILSFFSAQSSALSGSNIPPIALGKYINTLVVGDAILYNPTFFRFEKYVNARVSVYCNISDATLFSTKNKLYLEISFITGMFKTNFDFMNCGKTDVMNIQPKIISNVIGTIIYAST